MERSQFVQLSDTCLERITAWLENFDPDEVDFDQADGVVTLVFADGMKYVLNRQSAADQMWFAAGARAWHYEWIDDAQAWRCDKDAHDLIERIGECVGDKLGRKLTVD